MDRSDDPEFQKWAREVKIRDNWECQICGAQGVYLEAHHKNAWNAYPDQRYDITTGVCLCYRCHHRFHDMFGYGDNTEFQFAQYEDIANTIRKIASQKNPPGLLSHDPDKDK
jgi:5-methylcytosine-specific restriction endonuclease McrA